MTRARKMTSWEQEQEQARKARREAFEVLVNANPELYNSLKDAIYYTNDAYLQIDRKYRELNQAKQDAAGLSETLMENGLVAEAEIAGGILRLLERAIEPLRGPRREASEAHDRAQKAFDEHFPNAPK